MEFWNNPPPQLLVPPLCGLQPEVNNNKANFSEKLILTKMKICKVENKHVLERINKTKAFYSKRLIELIPSLVGLVGKNRDEATYPPEIKGTVL